MYVGIASGSTNSRSTTARPGKRYMVTSQAADVPTISARAPAPTSSHAVLASAFGNTVANRCAQMLSPGPKARISSATMGRAKIAANRSAASVQAVCPGSLRPSFSNHGRAVRAVDGNLRRRSSDGAGETAVMAGSRPQPYISRRRSARNAQVAGQIEAASST